MPTLQDSQSWIEQTYASVATAPYEQSFTEAGGGGLPPALKDWLGRLRLLYGVPFTYLVPDERMLPKESIRFFFLDRSWTDRLVDGALSVGKLSTREQAHHQAVKDQLEQDLDDEERGLRIRLRGLLPADLTGRGADITGLLLRSAAVSGWPGLEAKAYREEAKLDLLRMDRLAPDVLLCLFQGIPTRVDLEEPGEGVQLGFDEAADIPSPSGLELSLRHLSGEHIGRLIGGGDIDEGQTPIRVPVPVRASDQRVVHVGELRATIAAELGAIGAAELALELLQLPYRQRFEEDGDTKTDPTFPKLPTKSAYRSATFPALSIGALSDEERADLVGAAAGATDE